MSATPLYAGWTGDFNRNTEIKVAPATHCHRNLIYRAHVQKSPTITEQMYHFPDVSTAAAVLECWSNDSEVGLRSDNPSGGSWPCSHHLEQGLMWTVRCCTYLLISTVILDSTQANKAHSVTC